MIRLDLQEALKNLREQLDKLAEGDLLVLCENDVPIAEVRRLVSRHDGPSDRPLGLAKGEITIHPSFMDPLPEDVVSGFEGGAR